MERAGWETRATADLEVCATASSRLSQRLGSNSAPESLAMCLWTHRKGGDAGIGKIMQGKIMRSFYDFARHDFAIFFFSNRKCQDKPLPR
jgi:hypothetical protein